MFMANEPAMTQSEGIDAKIHLIRGQRVMLDSDLARLFGVPTKRLLEQFKRNRNRFPRDFAFELNRKELTTLRSQIATPSLHGGRRYLPVAFTEHGAVMLATILNSPVAVEANIRVVRAFVYLREQLLANRDVALKFAELEKRLDEHDESIASLFEAIRRLLEPPSAEETRKEIGFHIRENAPPYRIRLPRTQR
jgi:hypothetical protein